MNTYQKVSIYNIAELAGVSASTVSRVVNSDSRISSNTATKVKQVMARLNYIPAPAAKRRGNRVGVKKQSVYKLAFYTEGYCDHALIDGINEFALAAGHEFQSVINKSAIYRPGDLLDKRLDGLIFFRRPERLLASRLLNKLAAVRAFGPQRIDLCDFDHVTYNGEHVTELAVNYLASKGFKQFGMYYHKYRYAAEHRMGLFNMYARRNGASLIDLGFKEEAAGYSPVPTKAVKQLIESNSAPYGIFVYNDRLAACLHMQLLSLGLTAGRDFMLVSCDNDSEALRPILPRPATVDLHFKEIGFRAAEQLVWRINNPEALVQSVHITPCLIES